jgi:hypothetical protein
VLTLSSSNCRARVALAALDASRRRSWTVADTWSPRKRAGAGSR